MADVDPGIDIRPLTCCAVVDRRLKPLELVRCSA